MKTLIVIPARYASTRLPGKPLVEIAGRTMLSRVIHVARAAAEETGAGIVVATDYDRIRAHAEDCGAPAVMTDPDLASGTDRALAALDALESDADFVVNLQGDAPFTPVSHITALIQARATTISDVVTVVVPLTWDALDTLRTNKQSTPFSGTTCIRQPGGQALWFSKNIIPAIRKEDDLRRESPISPVFQHIGLYGYDRAALERFAGLPLGHYEALEGLEQLRFLENGMTIHAEIVELPAFSSGGIDTEQDIARVEADIARFGDPHAD